MKKYFLFLLFISVTAFAQKDTNSMKLDVDKLLQKLDSSRKMMDSLEVRRNERLQKEILESTLEQNNRNLDAFLKLQKEREAKQKKAMWMRIGFGIVLLGVFVFGMLRKRAKKITNNK